MVKTKKNRSKKRETSKKEDDGPGIAYNKKCETFKNEILQKKDRIKRVSVESKSAAEAKRKKSKQNYHFLTPQGRKVLNIKRQLNAELLKNFRTANNMNAKGYVKYSAKVMVCTASLAKNHPFFHSVPFYKPKNLPEHLISDIQHAEHLIFETSRSNLHQDKHRDGGNEGINLGFKVCSGGGHSCKKYGRSGTIQASNLLDKKGCLISRDDVWDLVKEVLEEMYGMCPWYQRAVKLAEKLNEEAGYHRCIPGTPVSGIWITTSAKEASVHIDKNVVGPSFVFSVWMDEDNPVYLNVSSVDGKKNKRIPLCGKIVGGMWSTFPHCNSGTNSSNSGRRSWTLYMDHHIFSLLYRDIKEAKMMCRKCGDFCCTFTDPQYVDGYLVYK